MVRATADGAAPRLQVVRSTPTAGELAHAFAALSLALGHATAATALAHDDALAAAYVRRAETAGARRAA